MGAHQQVAIPTHRPLYQHLYFQVVCAILIGILLGHFYATLAAKMQPLGEAFIKTIKMLIGPIIFCTVVHGIASMNDIKPRHPRQLWPEGPTDSPRYHWRHGVRPSEIFAMHGFQWPMSGSRRCRRHHAGGAARVEMGAGPEVAQCRSDVQPLAGIAAVVVKHHPPHCGENRKIIEKRRFPGRAGTIMQKEIGPSAAQYRDHRHDRGDSDAAGNEQIV
jgi:hypothetical protein